MKQSETVQRNIITNCPLIIVYRTIGLHVFFELKLKYCKISVESNVKPHLNDEQCSKSSRVVCGDHNISLQAVTISVCFFYTNRTPTLYYFPEQKQFVISETLEGVRTIHRVR